MSTHGPLQLIGDHPTHHNIDGEWIVFCYVEPMSCYNCSKQWVDEANNCCHDPIALDVV